MICKNDIFSGSLAAVFAVVLGSCGSSSVSSPNADIPVPTAKMAKASGQPIDTLGEGYTVFLAHCAQCHELKMPKDMKIEEWHSITPGMAWNAGLKKADEGSLMAYLVAATQQVQKNE